MAFALLSVLGSIARRRIFGSDTIPFPTTGGFGLPTRLLIDLRSLPNQHSTSIALRQSTHAMVSAALFVKPASPGWPLLYSASFFLDLSPTSSNG